MSFSEYLDQAWSRHAEDPEGVFASFDEGARLAGTPGELAGLATLVGHVAGEHLGRFEDARARLEGLRAHAAFDHASAEAGAIHRSLGAVALALGDEGGAARWTALARSEGVPAASDTARVLATAAAMLAGAGRLDEAARRYEAALAAASYGLTARDPASRALAVISNNLAASLEERAERAPALDALMVRAATEARRCWEIAGTWLHVERAEYRLSRSLSVAGRHAAAETHARACLALCAQNDAPPEERFFGLEALALALHGAGRAREAAEARDAMAGLLGRVPEDWADYCKGALDAVSARLGA